MKRIFSFLIFAFLFSTLNAQVELHLSAQRQNFVLYESIIMDVDVKNLSPTSIFLENNMERSFPWLSFIILGADGKKITADRPLLPTAQILKKGENFHLAVNITPYYKIRDTGQYQVQAVAYVDEKNTIMTDPLIINVGMGSVFWTQSQSAGGVDRIYSLVYFAEKDQSRIYLRVEEPQNNVVYGSILLGTVNASLDVPPPLFDAKGNVHILHPNSDRSRLYTVLDSQGKILSQQECDLAYQLKQNARGEVSLTKTISQPNP